MKIQSSYPGKVFFRLFKPTDTAYVIGIDEGVLHGGQEVEYLVAGFGTFKIEFKEECLTGRVLKAAGEVYGNDTTFWIQPHGAVVQVGVIQQ